jgi:hypothetical protein
VVFLSVASVTPNARGIVSAFQAASTPTQDIVVESLDGSLFRGKSAAIFALATKLSKAGFATESKKAFFP